MHNAVACTICHAPSAASWRWKSPYRVHACGDCGLLFCDPMPTGEQLAEFYDGFLYRKPDDAQIEQLVAAKERELLRLLGDRHTLKGKTFLDFGGGTGVAFAAATRLGMDVHYYEIDPQATAYVREKFDLAPERAYSEVEQIPRQKFDVVWADNVIEHDPNVHAFMQTMKALLRPKGQALIKTPHAQTPDLWFYPAISVMGYTRTAFRVGGLGEALSVYAKRRWTTDPPRHVFAFSRDSLAKVATATGFAAPRIEHYHHPLLEYAFIKRVAKRPRSLGSLVFRPVIIVLAVVELAMKPVQIAVRAVWPLVAAGVMLRVQQNEAE